MSVREQTYRIAGHLFRVRSGHPEFLDELRGILRPFARRGPLVGGSQHYEIERPDWYVLRKGRRTLFRCPELGDAVEFLEADILAQLVRLLDSALLLHAGAVVRDRTLMVFPAAPGSGKTTLVAGLIKRGCLYLTDEMLILSPRTMRVRPLPLALNMKIGSVPLFPEPGPELQPARRLRPQDPPRRIRHMRVSPRCRQRGWLAPRRVALLFPVYRAGVSARLETLSRVEAIRRLAAVCYNHHRFGASRFVACMERLTRGARCAALEYGSFDEALDLIDRQVLPLASAPGLALASGRS